MTTDTIQTSLVEPSVRLTNEERQKHKDEQRESKSKSEEPVLKELSESFQNEMYASNFEPQICYDEARAIIELLYGEVHCVPLPVKLSERIAIARLFFDRLLSPTFPKTTFVLFLGGLGFVQYSQCAMPGKFRHLAADLSYIPYRNHKALMDRYKRSSAIDVDDAMTLTGTHDRKLLVNANLSGPEKARLLRRIWPDVVKRGLIVSADFVNGLELHLSFQTFQQVEDHFSAFPSISVFDFLKNLGVAHLKKGVCNRAESGLQSIDLSWRRQFPIRDSGPPHGAHDEYPIGTVPPINLLNPQSWSPFLSQPQIESFQSCERSPAEKARLFKMLWAKVSEVGILVPHILGVCEGEGILIENGFITFPPSDIPILERFFLSNPSWSAWSFANLVGFCLRLKEIILLGGGTCMNDSTQRVNYWIASRVKTVGQVVKNMKRIWAASEDEDLVFSPNNQFADAA